MPAWARESLGDLPAIMARTSSLASRLDAGALDRVEAALLVGHEGDVFEGIVLLRRKDGARVQLSDPPVEAAVPGLDAVPGTVVHLRLVAASVADGTVAFVAS